MQLGTSIVFLTLAITSSPDSLSLSSFIFSQSWLDLTGNSNQKGIDDLAQHYLAKKGISAARRVKKSDMEKLARATGAKVVSSVDELTKEDYLLEFNYP